jgi:hypothetical protein
MSNKHFKMPAGYYATRTMGGLRPHDYDQPRTMPTVLREALNREEKRRAKETTKSS